MGASTRGYGRTCRLTQPGHATGEGPPCVIRQGRESLPRPPRARQAWLCDNSYTDTSSGPLSGQSCPAALKGGARLASVTLSHCMQRGGKRAAGASQASALLILLFCEPRGWWKSGAGERVTEVSPGLGKGGWEARPDLRGIGQQAAPDGAGPDLLGTASQILPCQG